MGQKHSGKGAKRFYAERHPIYPQKTAHGDRALTRQGAGSRFLTPDVTISNWSRAFRGAPGS